MGDIESQLKVMSSQLASLAQSVQQIIKGGGSLRKINNRFYKFI